LEVNYTINRERDGLFLGYTAAVNFILRVIIFIWKDDTAPTTTTIVDPYPGIDSPIMPLDHDRKVKRKILYDQTHSFYTDQTNSLCQNSILTRRFCIPLTRLKMGMDTINYIGGSTTGVNNIYLLLISNQSTAAAPVSSWPVTVITRYNFVDV